MKRGLFTKGYAELKDINWREVKCECEGVWRGKKDSLVEGGSGGGSCMEQDC